MITLRREIGDAATMDDMADVVGEGRGKAYFDAFARKCRNSPRRRSADGDPAPSERGDSSQTRTMLPIAIGVAVLIGAVWLW